MWLQNTSMSMLRTRYGPALSLPTTDGHELEPPNNGNVSWSANEPYTTAFVVKSWIARPFMPRRMSVGPVASHTRTPLGTGIIAAPAPAAPP